jgi:hypothetical protein
MLYAIEVVIKVSCRLYSGIFFLLVVDWASHLGQAKVRAQKNCRGVHDLTRADSE